MPLLAYAVAFAGFIVLSPAVRRSGPAAGRWAPRVRTAIGHGLIALALLPSIAAFGGSVGILVWLGFLSAAALAVTALLAWRSHLALWAAFGLPMVALALLLSPIGRA